MDTVTEAAVKTARLARLLEAHSAAESALVTTNSQAIILGVAAITFPRTLRKYDIRMLSGTVTYRTKAGHKTVPIVDGWTVEEVAAFVDSLTYYPR